MLANLCIIPFENTVSSNGIPRCTSLTFTPSKSDKRYSQNKGVLDAAIREERDFEYDYFGFKTLEKSYLLRYVLTC